MNLLSNTTTLSTSKRSRDESERDEVRFVHLHSNRACALLSGLFSEGSGEHGGSCCRSAREQWRLLQGKSVKGKENCLFYGLRMCVGVCSERE